MPKLAQIGLFTQISKSGRELAKISGILFLLIKQFYMITEVELVDYGICQTINESVDEAEDSITGYFLHSSEITFTDKIDKIRFVSGLAFGIKYLLKGIEGEEAELFEVRINYPQIVNPESKFVSTEVTEMKVGAIDEMNFDYYRLEHDWEAQPGEWLFEIRQNNRLLLQKRFEITL